MPVIVKFLKCIVGEIAAVAVPFLTVKCCIAICEDNVTFHKDLKQYFEEKALFSPLSSAQ